LYRSRLPISRRRIDRKIMTSIGCARPTQAGIDLRIQRSLITEYLSELRASCLQAKSRRSRETSSVLEKAAKPDRETTSTLPI
jgi:hypothetical protein